MHLSKHLSVSIKKSMFKLKRYKNTLSMIHPDEILLVLHIKCHTHTNTNTHKHTQSVVVVAAAVVSFSNLNTTMKMLPFHCWFVKCVFFSFLILVFCCCFYFHVLLSTNLFQILIKITNWMKAGHKYIQHDSIQRCVSSKFMHCLLDPYDKRQNIITAVYVL